MVVVLQYWKYDFHDFGMNHVHVQAETFKNYKSIINTPIYTSQRMEAYNGTLFDS